MIVRIIVIVVLTISLIGGLIRHFFGEEKANKFLDIIGAIRTLVVIGIIIKLLKG